MAKENIIELFKRHTNERIGMIMMCENQLDWTCLMFDWEGGLIRNEASVS